jgi:hypothetical protein
MTDDRERLDFERSYHMVHKAELARRFRKWRLAHPGASAERYALYQERILGQEKRDWGKALYRHDLGRPLDGKAPFPADKKSDD